MSIKELEQKGLLPHKLKYLGFAVSLICVLYALTYHFIEPNLLFSGLHKPKMIFVFGLIIMIGSKEPFEDERVRQIRSYVHYILSGFFTGYIFLQELDGNIDSMINELAGFLTIYLLIFHFIYYFGTDLIIKNRGTFWFVVTVLIIGLYILFDLLWAT